MGAAFSLDREILALLVTKGITEHLRVEIVRNEVSDVLESKTIIAYDSLTSKRLTQTIPSLTGEEHLHFYAALAPTLYANTITIALRNTAPVTQGKAILLTAHFPKTNMIFFSVLFYLQNLSNFFTLMPNEIVMILL